MLKNLVGGSPSSERAGKSPRAADRKLRAVVESLEGRTMMSVAVSGVAHRLIPIPAEATTVTSSRVTSNLASPDVASAAVIDLDFPKPLMAEIASLEKAAGHDAGKVPQGRKAVLLNQALDNYKKVVSTTFASTMTVYKLTDPGMYAISSKGPKEPSYFSDTFKNYNTAPVMTTTERYYDYNPKVPAGNKAQFWVDFANEKLGGGVFGNGFVQEEVMFLETPELANAAAQPATGRPPLHTRTGNNPYSGPLEGDPTPLIFVGANRVMDIDQAILNGTGTQGNEPWETAQFPGTFKSADRALPSGPIKPAQINVLAMAAPDVSKTTSSKAAPDIVKDLFNTFVAGFSLARSDVHKGETVLINTGPIGAGAFKNSPVVVNVMQQLAAKQEDVNLKFWSYKTADSDLANNDVTKILKDFNAGTNKSISNLLVIAEYVMRDI